MSKSQKLSEDNSMFLGKTLFCGKSMSFDLSVLSRCEIFDRKGRIYDVPRLRAVATVREALYGDVADELKAINKAFDAGKPAKLTLVKYEQADNFFTRPDKFCVNSVDLGDDFYSSKIGTLTPRQEKLGITRKQIFDITELLSREYLRIEKIRRHLDIYGDDIFDNDIRGSWPNKFVLPLVEHLRQSAKREQKGRKIKFLDDLTKELLPNRITGIQTVGLNGYGLRILDKNWKLFLDRRLGSIDAYWSKFCTSKDIYDNRPDTVVDAAREIAAIVMTAKRFRDKKWEPKLDLGFNAETKKAESWISDDKYSKFLLACRIYLDHGPNGPFFDNFC
jgi:hypothetical protein